MESLAITALALVFVLVLAWVVLKAISLNYKRTQSGGHIKVIETANISPKDRVAVIRYRDEDYLVGINGQSFTLLDKNQVNTESLSNMPVQHN